jgi:CelD/BcsL family acetyltransferase involved in cellulose biosynthesis
MPETIEWITDEDGFAELGEAWDAVLPSDARPFDLHAWYRAWWRAFAGSSQLAVCTVWMGDELRAVCPLLRTRLGAVRAQANLETPAFRPLARDGTAMRKLAEALTKTRVGSLEIRGLPSGDTWFAALEEAARSAGMWSVIEPQYSSPIVETDGEYEAWRAATKPRWGAPLERFRRKTTREYDARFDVVEPPQDLESELDAGLAVEASGWKGRSGTAILSSPKTERFYRDLASAFHARGELRLSRIVLDGETAAFDLSLLYGGRLYLLKTGYDERFRKLAPGLVLRLSIIECCFERGYAAHELLGEEEPWKLKFATTERRHFGLRAYRHTPAAAGRYAYWARIRPRLKKVYRSVRPRR